VKTRQWLMLRKQTLIIRGQENWHSFLEQGLVATKNGGGVKLRAKVERMRQQSAEK
jgi:hypothetical protein